MRTVELKALFVAIAWLLAYVGLARYFVLLLPHTLTFVLSLSLYLWLVQVMAALFGVLLVRALSQTEPGLEGRLLPWSKGQTVHPTTRRSIVGGVIFAVAIGPLLYVVAHSLGMFMAYRTLLAELAAQGARAVQQQTGALGRAAASDQLWSLLPFTVIVAPLAEELLFRGAWYGAFESLFSRTQLMSRSARAMKSAPSSIPGLRRSKAREKNSGPLLAWLLSSLVFGLMHADISGGMGIMRTASSSLLGLACGYARLTTGTLIVPILMHASFNFVSLSTLRGWLIFDGFPSKFALPTSLLLIAPLTLALGWGLRKRLHWENG